MKKVFAILAVMMMSTGFYSCEADSNLEETQALYQDATDGDEVPKDGRDN